MFRVLEKGKIEDFWRGFQAMNRGVTGMNLTYTLDYLVSFEKYRKRTLVDIF